MNLLPGAENVKNVRSAKITLNYELYSNGRENKVFRVRYRTIVTIEEILEINMLYHYHFYFRSYVNFSAHIAKLKLVRSVAPSMAYPYVKIYAEQLILMSNLGGYNLRYFYLFEKPMGTCDSQ